MSKSFGWFAAIKKEECFVFSVHSVHYIKVNGSLGDKACQQENTQLSRSTFHRS